MYCTEDKKDIHPDTALHRYLHQPTPSIMPQANGSEAREKENGKGKDVRILRRAA
jgi:hypothetical protein